MSHRTAPLWVLSLIVAVAALGFPAAAAAYSLLPLTTEEAQTLPSGVIEATLGINYFKDLRYPAFTPPGIIHSQTLMALPQVAFRVGVGDWAEFEASYEMLYLHEQAINDATNNQYGGGDIRIFTKLWFLRERKLVPALGLRFGTKLPNATRTSNLGTDDTDFAATVLASKTFGQVTTLVNLGILLLGNSGPSVGNSFAAGSQDDLVSYSVAAASAPLGATTEGATTIRLLGEIAGQTASRFDNDRSDIRAGAQLQRGRVTLYLGISTGLMTGSEKIGAATGFTYTFDSTKLFESE